MDKCRTCEYNERAECHRYPPVVIAKPDIPTMFVFPMVDPNDWCGEHKKAYDENVKVGGTD